MTDKYILDEAGNPQPEPDLLKWGKWLETGNRRVKQDTLPNGVKVSTVFLGLDHSFRFGDDRFTDLPPVLWETMIFGGPHDQYQDRYTSKEAALEGHEYALKLAKGEVSLADNPEE